MDQLSLFSAREAKGSSEWAAFNTIKGDTAGMFRVATPIPEQPRYTNVVHIRRFNSPHRLFPKPAH